MNTEGVELVLVGLQETGKTRYLAALGLAILQTRTRRLALASYGSDRIYLNEIGSLLARCDPSPHTEMGEHRGLDLPISIDAHEIGRLIVPDVSGETWEHAVDEREWSVDLDERIREADGVLLFVHSQGSSGPLIGELTSSLKQAPPEDQKPFKPSMTPMDVQVVDLLQLLGLNRARSRKVALIISAWDLVGDVPSPGKWIDDNCRLLRQYLDNLDNLEVKAWGVSAQGGSYTDEDAIKDLKPVDPVDRIRVVDEGGSPGIVDDPILWLLENDQS